MSQNYDWIDDGLPNHGRLTDSVVNILENLLNIAEIDYLSVSGRTKEKDSIKEKIERKHYKNPAIEMTDVSGIRVIVYFESDIKKVSEIIEQSFEVDSANSLNLDDKLSIDQIGYRSVHYVCELGADRKELPEFSGLNGLKCEIQVRTVLQHAWAELAHDRNYKFAGKLPTHIERKLYLYAGMLEIADSGFSELSSQIDKYIKDVNTKTKQGELGYKLDALSLKQFVENWSEANSVELIDTSRWNTNINELLEELAQFGISTAQQLSEIIPSDYPEKISDTESDLTTFSVVRHWMLIHDWRKFVSDVQYDWAITPQFASDFNRFLSGDELKELLQKFRTVGI